MGVEDKEKESQLDDIERIKSSLHKEESNLSDITLVEKDEDAGKFFADIDLDKLEEGDVDEFNKVVKDLTDINYEKLSNNDKTEISAMLNRIKEFNFEDIDFEIDPKKIGDMLQNMGGFFIDPYILGTLANYADISGREQAVIVPMLYMDYDEMSNALNNIGKVKLAQTLNGFLSNDDINRDVLDKNIGNLERLFQESDINHIDDENIAKMLDYSRGNKVEIGEEMLLKVVEKKDIDVVKCFGSNLNNVIDEIDKIRSFNWGGKFSKEQAKNILMNVDGTRLVKIFRKLATVRNLREINRDEMSILIDRVKELENDNNNKLIDEMIKMREKKEIRQEKDVFKDIDLAKLENGDVEELKKVVKISNYVDYYNLSEDNKAEIKSVLSKIKNFDLENIEVDVDREKIGDILVNIDVEPDMFGVLFRYADIDVSRDNREVIGKVLSFDGLDDDKFEDLLETIDKEKLLTLFTESMYSSTHHVSLERSYSRERIVKLLSNCDMNIMSDTVIGRTINFLDIHNDLGLIDKNIVVNVFNKNDVNVGVCFGGFLTDIINKTDISGINFKESVIEDILEQVDLEKIDATKLMDILDKSDMKYLDKDRMKEIENKLVSLGDEKSKGLIEKMNAVQEVSIDELNSISDKRLGNLLKNKGKRKFDINDIDNSNLSNALNFLGSKVVDLDERVLTDIFNKKDIDVVECFGRHLPNVINKLDLSKINMDKKMATAIKDEVNEEKIDKGKYRYIEQKSKLRSRDDRPTIGGVRSKRDKAWLEDIEKALKGHEKQEKQKKVEQAKKEVEEPVQKKVEQEKKEVEKPVQKEVEQEKNTPEVTKEVKGSKIAGLMKNFEKGNTLKDGKNTPEVSKEIKGSKIAGLMKNFEKGNTLKDGKNTPEVTKEVKGSKIAGLMKNFEKGNTLKDGKNTPEVSNNKVKEALKHFKEGPNNSYSVKKINRINKDIVENNISKGVVEAKNIKRRNSVGELAKRFEGLNEKQKPNVKKGPEK